MKLTSSEQPEAPVQRGQLIGGRYRVGEVIAYGGMGIICKGEHVELQQPIAIKFIRQELMTSRKLVEGFLNEARTAATLSSAHVVRMIDFGQLLTGMPYMVMEYLDGLDLQTLIQQEGCLHVSAAIRYALQLCEALAEAHAAGVVHRDIKPENLFISARPGRRPVLKVLDFGIAKQRGNVLQRWGRGEVVGSPWYMSPEQIQSPALVDFRTDIWSTGVVLFEMLSGRLPFEGTLVDDVCRKVVCDAPPSLDGFQGDIPPRLVRLVNRCLQKRPADRFASVEGITEQLEACHVELHTHRHEVASVAVAHATQAGPLESATIGEPYPEPPPSSTPPPVAARIGTDDWLASPALAVHTWRRTLAIASTLLLAGWAVSLVRAAAVNEVPEPAAPASSPAPAQTSISPSASHSFIPALQHRGVAGDASSIAGAVRAERQARGSDLTSLREATRLWRERTADERRQAYRAYLKEEGLTPVREVLAELRQTPSDDAAENTSYTTNPRDSEPHAAKGMP